MGNSIRTWTRYGLSASVLFAVLLVVGCASGGRTAPAAPAPPASSTQVSEPAQILSLELREEGEIAHLEVVADRSLVWTNYRDSLGNLVVELPNSQPTSSVGDLASAEGLVASVEIERLDDAERPLTRLVVRTREDSEHSLTTEGSTLELQLMPAGWEAPVALAYDPLEEQDLEARSAPAVGESTATGPRVDASPAHYGTPDAPLAGPSPSGAAASRLFAVEFHERGSETVVQVAGDGEFEYSTFRLENPDRFVIDLQGVVNTSSLSTLEVDTDEIDRVRIGQFKPRPDPVSRVVFDLRRMSLPRIERTPDGLIVAFGSAVPPVSGEEPARIAEQADPAEKPAEEAIVAQEPPAERAEPTPAEVVATYEHEETPAEPEIYEPEETYEREEIASQEPPVSDPAATEPAADQDAGEEVVAEFGGPAAGAPAAGAPAAGAPAAPPRSEEPTLVAEYQPAAPPPTPAQAFLGERERRSAPPAGGPSDVSLYEAQQIESGPGVAQRPEPVTPTFDSIVVNRRDREYVGEPISMSLKNADLVETLRSFASISGLNFVIQPGVSGSVTVELRNVPWDQAMEQILKINNLGMDIDGTIVRIAPADQLQAEAEAEAEIARNRMLSIPLRTVIKHLSYASATEVSTLLRNQSGAILSARGTVQVDQRTNALIIREIPQNIDTVLAVIENLDTPEPQVTIEARIIEATKSFARSLGIEWGFDAIAENQFGNTTGLQFPNNYDIDGGVGLLTGGANGFLNLSMGNILNTFNLNARLQAAENEGLVNIISAPSVTTLNNTAASIQSGLQIPIQTVSNRTVSVQFVNATLQLTVQPHVTAEGTIILDLNVAKRSPQLAFAIVGAANAPIATKEASTTVIVRDGGTAVIGGIYEVSSDQSEDRVPGLANIPILKHLFKNRDRNESNDELMIFVTPRIVQM